MMMISKRNRFMLLAMWVLAGLPLAAVAGADEQDVATGGVVIQIDLQESTPARVVDDLFKEARNLGVPLDDLKINAVKSGNEVRIYPGAKLTIDQLQELLGYFRRQTHVQIPSIQIIQKFVDEAIVDHPVETPISGVLKLKHGSADVFVTLMKELLRDDLPSIAVADEHTIVVRGTQQQLDQLTTLLQQLDIPREAAQVQTIEHPIPIDAEIVFREMAQVSLPGDQNLGSRIKAARETAQQAELKSIDLAKQLRQRGVGADDQDARKLRDVVKAAFQARQQLHQLEVFRLQQRTADLSARIRTRQQVADRIIQRRAADLLNPELSWEASPIANVPGQPGEGGKRDSADADVQHVEIVAGGAEFASVPKYTNVQVAVDGDDLVLRGKAEDIETVKQVIAEARKKKSLAHLLLRTATQLLQLAREGRIPEAAHLTVNPEWATQLAGINEIEDLRVIEVAASKEIGYAITQSITPSHTYDDAQYLMEFSILANARDRRWRLTRVEQKRESDVNIDMERFLKGNPDGQVLFVGPDGVPEDKTYKVSFRRARWTDVVDWLSKRMNADVVVSDLSSVEGGFSYQSPTPITAQKAFRLAQAELWRKGVHLGIAKRNTPDQPAGRGRGRISEVNDGLVTLSLGENDGLKPGDELDVTRDGVFIGVVEVGFVQLDQSIARPKAGYRYGVVDFKVDDELSLSARNRETHVPEEFQAALSTARRFMSLVTLQDLDTAAEITAFDLGKHPELQQVRDKGSWRLTELIGLGDEILAITSEVEIGETEQHLVFSIQDGLIQKIDLETKQSLGERRKRVLSEHPLATRVVLSAGSHRSR